MSYNLNNQNTTNHSRVDIIGFSDFLSNHVLTAMLAQRQTEVDAETMTNMVERTLNAPNGNFHEFIMYVPSTGNKELADGLHRVLMLSTLAHVLLQQLSASTKSKEANLIKKLNNMLYVDGDITKGYKHDAGMMNRQQTDMVFGIDETGMPLKLEPSKIVGENSLVRLAMDIQANIESAADSKIVEILHNLTTARITVKAVDTIEAAIELFEQVNRHSKTTKAADDLRAAIGASLDNITDLKKILLQYNNMILGDFSGDIKLFTDAAVAVMNVMRQDNSTRTIKSVDLTKAYEIAVGKLGSNAAFKEFVLLCEDYLHTGMVRNVESFELGRDLEIEIKKFINASYTKAKDLKSVIILGMSKIRTGEWTEETVANMVSVLRQYATVSALQHTPSTDITSVAGKAIKMLKTVKNEDVILTLLNIISTSKIPSAADVKSYLEVVDVRMDNGVTPWASSVIGCAVSLDDVRLRKNANQAHTIGAIEVQGVPMSRINQDEMDKIAAIRINQFIQDLPFSLR